MDPVDIINEAYYRDMNEAVETIENAYYRDANEAINVINDAYYKDAEEAVFIIEDAFEKQAAAFGAILSAAKPILGSIVKSGKNVAKAAAPAVKNGMKQIGTAVKTQAPAIKSGFRSTMDSVGKVVKPGINRLKDATPKIAKMSKPESLKKVMNTAANAGNLALTGLSLKSALSSPKAPEEE